MGAIRADEGCAPRGKGRNKHHPRIVFRDRFAGLCGYKSRERAEWIALASDDALEVREYRDAWDNVRFALVPSRKARGPKPVTERRNYDAALVTRFADQREAMQASSVIGMQDRVKNEYLRSQAIRLGLAK